MKNERLRRRFQIAATMLSLLVAMMAALAMRDRARLVDIVALFAGGMGAGASLVQMVLELRRSREERRDSGD
jgi:hypothetical protein